MPSVAKAFYVSESVKTGGNVNRLEKMSPCKWSKEDVKWVFETLRIYVKTIEDVERKMAADKRERFHLKRILGDDRARALGIE